MKSFAIIALLLSAFSDAKIRGLAEFREVRNSLVDGMIDYVGVRVSEIRLPSYFGQQIADAFIIPSLCCDNVNLTNCTVPLSLKGVCPS